MKRELIHEDIGEDEKKREEKRKEGKEGEGRREEKEGVLICNFRSCLFNFIQKEKNIK